MYLTFYGLKENPFALTPDPRFLYQSPGHREALAQLLYGVQERKGFMVLTGEVGTGKTTLLHALLQRLYGKTAVALIVNSTLSFEEILEYALEELGVPQAGETRVQRLLALQRFLLDRQSAGQNTVLILDEAQNLSVETLEQIRLLSNFETSSEKLLQILFVGQPELRDRLEDPSLRQLKQRIGLRSAIPQLSVAQTHDYVRARLRIAGARDPGLFTKRALASIADYAGGIPRIINTVCDHCLVVGYASQVRRIDQHEVVRALEQLDGDRKSRRRWSFLRRFRRRGISRTHVTAGAFGAGVAGLFLLPLASGGALGIPTWLTHVGRTLRDWFGL